MKLLNSATGKGIALAIGLVVAQITVLFILGQPPICACGYVKLWEGVVKSSGNSQHLSDWYTFSHIIHGFAFYLLLRLIFPRAPVALRLAGAVGIEVGWEILENTPMVINHYRKQALAQGYTGDSIINSVFDTIWMVLGFVAAWRIPVWGSIASVALMEVFVAFCIRDNLMLNIINLVYPFEFIAKWQSSA
ncbi:MAG TPA: DUF2585 family protein [Candidatus Hydrogenedentes bacterium]|nr:DUF2585 family protein [Candidatus Hydrogenedentota bacterium]HRK34097.1 DUF2585 family protein [Candidatus Hydrogenedentota bacterium]